MKKKVLPFLFLTVLTLITLTGPVRAQFTTGISVGVNNPLRSTVDSLPGIRSGLSISVQPGYTIQRIRISGTVGYQTLNTGAGFEALAHQYGYTQEKGFILHPRSGGLVNLTLGAGYNLLPAGSTACGLPKPALFLGVQGGVLITAGKIDGEVKTKAGETAFALRQTGNATTAYYRASLELLYPLSNTMGVSTAAGWSRAANGFDLRRSNNGNNNSSRFTYSDLQYSIGVQVAFKGIQEKGIKRSSAIAVPAMEGNGGEGNTAGTGGIDPSGTPQARTTGQPIGGIVVKGGVNPGSKPKPHNMVAGNPIGGIIVKGGKNPGGIMTVFNNGNGKGIQEKGMKYKAADARSGGGDAGSPDGNGTGPDLRSASLVYTEDFTVDDPDLLRYLGVDELVIEKGEYKFDYSANPEGRVILHLHSAGIIHRDLAARSFVFEGTDADGQTSPYAVEPLYSKGIAKDILVTYKGIQEKGIK